jgi:hypothetical protein
MSIAWYLKEMVTKEFLTLNGSQDAKKKKEK